MTQTPQNFGDKVAYWLTMRLRWVADTFFVNRYGHRAVVLETVAAVPGMVAGMLIHLRSLRTMKDDDGWIKILLEEAENERMHLMTFIEVAQPNWLERAIIMIAQMLFFGFYTALYITFPRIAHRMVGYFEEQAVKSYTQYLEQIDAGMVENISAPRIAKDYWKLSDTATLRDVVIVVRADEQGHMEMNHTLADALGGDKN